MLTFCRPTRLPVIPCRVANLCCEVAPQALTGTASLNRQLLRLASNGFIVVLRMWSHPVASRGTCIKLTSRNLVMLYVCCYTKKDNSFILPKFKYPNDGHVACLTFQVSSEECPPVLQNMCIFAVLFFVLNLVILSHFIRITYFKL